MLKKFLVEWERGKRRRKSFIFRDFFNLNEYYEIGEGGRERDREEKNQYIYVSINRKQSNPNPPSLFSRTHRRICLEKFGYD